MFKIRGLNTVIKYILSAALSITLFAAIVPKAAATPSPTMTHVELIQWLVQLCDAGSSLPPNPTAGDYVAWATAQGVVPAAGWQPNAVLTRDVLAQALVQFFYIDVKAGADAYKALKREGIDIPGGDNSITLKEFAKMADRNQFDGRTIVWTKHSKHKTPTHHKTPTKKKTPPKVKTPPKAKTPPKH